ncbi:protein MIZU-KUSSEI 1 isoform X2 [Rhodamnia argentea]|uniref:Protein MIZU-KUSSEI 1 isoform X2 n=1 Tax=Rhodamnia argentea TaxID=178133 RepID=A0A8B8NIJ4_9MYRT|nr:protein MIZU-KUSSEI 1 isoform X3 [Rhodamnia argentea]XP_030521890.2 protein MIZU-KUSSEI 1 isoform X2 [Rhodamnia argentea]
MKPLMARNSQDFSSKRHFHWTKKVGADEDNDQEQEGERDRAAHVVHALLGEHERKSSEPQDKKGKLRPDRSSEEVVVAHDSVSPSPTAKKKLQAIAVSKLRSVLVQFAKNVRSHSPGGGGGGLGSRVVGTIFGRRRGHVLFSLQKDASSQPAFLVELATPISGLVREMASGLVRIALECDKPAQNNSNTKRLLEEPVWRTYCNGKKCGFAARRDCGPKEWKVLKAVEPISMGAGVLPLDVEEEKGGGGGGGHESGGPSGGEGEMMYMRAKFERIVGSRDCEAFYMMNPDCNGAPELSVYLLRV